jgi:hypothetical protein
MTQPSAQLLGDAAKAVTLAWKRASAVWRDETARQFAEQFWSPAQDVLRRYQGAVERLERALMAAERLDD